MRKKILILVPLTWDMVTRAWAMNLVGLTLFNREKYDFSVLDGQSTFIDMTRDHLCEIARTSKKDYDYIFMMDADQLYPINTFDVLVSHIDSGKRVVAGVTPSRQYGFPLVFDLLPGPPATYRRIKTFDVNGTSLVKVDGTGLGGVMIHRSVLDEVPYPRFIMQYSDYLKRPVGDDVAFFDGVKKAGIDVYVDPQLKYEHLVMGSRRVEDWVEPGS